MITEPLTNPDEVEIRDLVADFATANFNSDRVRSAAALPLGYDEVTWEQMVDLGWTGLGIDEAAGGVGLGPVVQCIVLRELGARLAPTPYLATAGFAPAVLGVLAAREKALPLLESIVDGSHQYAVVLGCGTGWNASADTAVSATSRDESWELTGTVGLQLDAGRADRLLVLARTTATIESPFFDAGSEWRLFLVERADLTRPARDVPTVDVTRRFADVYLAATPAVALSEALSDAEVATVVDSLSVLLAAEMIGAATECLRQVLDYLKTRHQFGRPIGSFQALKHRCADLAVSLTVAQELLFSAATHLESGDHKALSLAAPVALARTSAAFQRTSEEAIQLHGGVGFTEEVDIGLYYRRALVDLELIASPADAYARVDAIRRNAT